MMYLCKCGRFKSGQPHKSSATKDWICDRCADRHPPKVVGPHVMDQYYGKPPVKHMPSFDMMKRKTGS